MGDGIEASELASVRGGEKEAVRKAIDVKACQNQTGTSRSSAAQR